MHADRFSFQQDLDAIHLKQLVNFSGNVRILTTQELLSVLHDGDITAKAAKHLAEFQTDVAAPQDQQVLRQILQFHDRSGVERCHGIESGDAGSCRPSAGIDEYRVGGQRPCAAGLEPYLNDVGAGEASVAENELDVLGVFQATLLSRAKVVHNFLLASADFGHVNTDGPAANAVVGGAPGQVSDSRTGDHGLRRCAAYIDARAADMLTLYDGRFSSSLAECNGKRCSCLSRPYYDGIIVIHKLSNRELTHHASEPGSQTPGRCGCRDASGTSVNRT